MRFCIFNSIEFDEERTNYFGYEFQRAKDYYLSYHMLGYYFCDGDDLTIENLKLATYQQAKQNCSKLLTPRFCSNKVLSNLLTELIARKEFENPGIDFNRQYFTLAWLLA